LTTAGTTAAILRISLSGDQIAIVGHLAEPVHDAGGAIIGGSPMVFGGGNLVPGTAVQRAGMGQGALIGRLPTPRADLAAVEVDGETIVVGGGTPARLDREVLSTTDGIHFRRVGTLIAGVRYPAVAVAGASILVIGGTDGQHDVTEIQAIDPATGSVRIIGHLPRGLSHAAAFMVAGHLLIAGGRSGGRAQDTIWEVDPVSGDVSAVGRLPLALSDAAVAVVGDIGYLIGGETDRLLSSIVSIRIE
jgi:N-acetylneuraminic acid mutarotase